MRGRIKYIENNNNFAFYGERRIIRVMAKSQKMNTSCRLYAREEIIDE